MASTFTLFPKLPPELRLQIWQSSLLSIFSSIAALSFYHKGFWHPRHLTPLDPDYDPVRLDLNTNFEFRHDLLSPIQFSIPLALVNREVRSIALAWAREHGLEFQRRKSGNKDESWGSHGRNCVFGRTFSPELDVLYIPISSWDSFCSEPDDRLFEPDLLQQQVSVGCPLRHIAVPEALFRNGLDIPAVVAGLADMVERWYFGVDVLFVVVGEQPEEGNGRWELESMEGERFVCEVGRETFKTDGELGCDEEMYGFVEKALKGLGKELRVRLVTAARR